MENSKSDVNNEYKTQETKKEEQTVGMIVDTNTEREIQNVLITKDHQQSQPCCSQTSGQHPEQTETKKVGLAKEESTSSISISVDVHSPTFNVNFNKIQENIFSSKSIIHEENSHSTENENTSSLNNLFDELEVLGPVTVTLPDFSVSNQPIQSPVVTNETVQSPPVHLPSTQTPITKQPQSLNQYPPLDSRNLEPSPTSSPGIHVVNIPNDSINRSLQRGDTVVNIPNARPNVPRADAVLGPPPSYSKSLLDRRVNPCASIQFVAPIPPPSYDGMESELRYAHNLGGHTGGFTLGLGNTWQGQPQPAYCPVCETVIITQVDVRVSRIAHILAMIMFLLLCWPFCLLPYFLNICNYTFHYCSVCHSFLGGRSPFQRG